VPREEHAFELEVRARRLPALRPSSVTTLIAGHSSDIVLETAARETKWRLRVGAAGIFPAVIGLPLLSAFTSLHDLFHSTAFVIARNAAIALAVVFWLGLAYWVHRDARRRIGDPFLVFLATLVGLAPPYIGPVVYLLFRPAETLDDVRTRRVELQALEQQLARSRPACPVCSSSVDPDFVACPVCTTMLRQPCAACKAPLEPLWQICPYCTAPVELSQVDLDAALTAETKRIALVDDTIPLVPQAEQRVADA
jgi:double zinc ribbon protein